MELNLEDLTAVAMDDLELIYEAVRVEIDARLTLAALPEKARAIAAEYEQAVAGKPANEWAPGTVAGPGDKVIEDGVEWINVSGAWLSAPPSAYPLGYRRTAPPADPVKPWIVNEAVKAGDLRRKGGIVYQCITGHTTAAHWAPDLPGMTALWIPAVQPTGGRSG